MIGTKFYKGQFTDEDYAACAGWCNKKGTATIVDKGDFYECIEIVISVDDLKEDKLLSLKAQRDAEELSPIECNGYLWDFDDKAQQRINGAITVLELTDTTFTWTSADNQEIMNVDATMLKQVVAAAAARSNGLHIKYRVLKAAVEEAETKEELDEINW